MDRTTSVRGRTSRIVLVVGALALATWAGTASTAQGAEPTPHVTVTPSAARPGQRITISGHLPCPDSAPGGHVLLRAEYADDDIYVVHGWSEPVPLTPDRDFSLEVTIPATMTEYGSRPPVERPTPPGQHHLSVMCDEWTGDQNDHQVSGSYTVLPLEESTTTTTAPTTTTEAVTTTTETTSTTTDAGPAFVPPAEPPTTADVFDNRPIGAVPAGSTLDIDEGGFVPGEEVHIVLYSSPRVLASVVADGIGTVRTTVTIPADTEPGEHVLVLYGSRLTRAMALDISAADPGSGPTDPGGSAGPSGSTGTGTGSSVATEVDDLPRTGARTTFAFTMTGLGLVAAGIMLLRHRDALRIVHD